MPRYYRLTRNRLIYSRDYVFYTGIIHIVACSVRFDGAELKLEGRKNEMSVRPDSSWGKPKKKSTPSVQTPSI